MTVLNVRSGENYLEFLHEENELWIYMDKVSIENERNIHNFREWSKVYANLTYIPPK